MQKPALTNKELKDLLKEGNGEAFELIYNSFYKKLFNYLITFTKCPYLSEDIVQEVFLKLWENHKIIFIHTSIERYLYKAVYFAFIDYYRKNSVDKKYRETIKSDYVFENFEIDNQLSELQIEKLNKAIEELPKRRKKIFVLGKVQCYRNAEIADSLNISIKTVERQISLAKKILREKVAMV